MRIRITLSVPAEGISVLVAPATTALRPTGGSAPAPTAQTTTVPQGR